MREHITTALDALGLLLLAAGIGLAVAGLIGFGVLAVAAGAGVAVGGVVVLAGSGVSAWQARRGERVAGRP